MAKKKKIEIDPSIPTFIGFQKWAKERNVMFGKSMVLASFCGVGLFYLLGLVV